MVPRIWRYIHLGWIFARVLNKFRAIFGHNYCTLGIRASGFLSANIHKGASKLRNFNWFCPETKQSRRKNNFRFNLNSNCVDFGRKLIMEMLRNDRFSFCINVGRFESFQGELDDVVMHTFFIREPFHKFPLSQRATRYILSNVSLKLSE